MATEEKVQLDFDQLLNPISGENPSGEDLKWDTVFDEIKAVRPKRSSEPDETPPDWRLIVELATTALSARTKDLMLAAWLTEAMISLNGFEGCRDGFKLLNELLERFWDTVYPEVPEDGDLERRLAPLLWCIAADNGGKLPFLLRESKLISNSVNGVISWNYWESSFRIRPKGNSETDEMFAARKQRSDEQAKAYQEAMRAASRDDIQRLSDDLHAAMAEVNRFNDILQHRFDRLAPGVSDLRKALEDCTDIADRTLKEKGGSDSSMEGTADSSPQDGNTGASWGGGVSAGAIRSRQEAFNRLEEIANYLRQVEPHSPVSYLVQRAVNWGRMPFEDLLQELLKDTTVRAQVGELLGIKPTDG